MWIKLAKNKDEIGDVKLIKKLAETAIRSLLFKQGHYNPSKHDVNWRVQRVLEEIMEEYGNLEDIYERFGEYLPKQFQKEYPDWLKKIIDSINVRFIESSLSPRIGLSRSAPCLHTHQTDLDG